ncbi:WYL domain-containing protein [Streptomyces olivaceiscleroticus]|uniref:WYL domain-containing protein n=1 Tax=Streptomyces olivaceiscleroticus TaxID=68245 RepID=A0ABN1BM52_9ACTN
MRATARRAIHTVTTAGQTLAHAVLGPAALLRYTLTRAAETGRQLVIDYVKESGEASTRTIAPSEVRRSKTGNWCVRAHDALRDATRTFRLDRITYAETA